MQHAKFSIVIHTEEEFDWSGGFNRNNNQMTHGKELTKMCQRMLDLGCCITFAMDWPFINSQEGKELVQYMRDNYSDQVEFATHLHPWVNPPFDEPQSQVGNIDEVLSYPGNLPFDIERAKLALLTDKIESVSGTRPTTYLAGRYGVGENTYKILSELGYKVDVSISPFADFSHQYGPNFSTFDNQTVIKEGITCIPHSSGYISYINALSDWLNKDASNLHKLNNNIVGKIIFRLLGVERVRLSPEGFNSKQMIKLTNSLIRIGIKRLIYSFHSSSSKVGGSPYSHIEKYQTLLTNNFDTLLKLRRLAETKKVDGLND